MGKIHKINKNHNTHTHIACFVLSSCLFVSAGFAEQSGAFIGVEVGYGGTEFQLKNSLDPQRSRTLKSGGGNYGITAGYKHFFNAYLGLRAYGNFNVLHTEFRADGVTIETDLLNYGVNVDFLGNFLSKQMVDFGGFVGVGLGGNTWQGKDINDLIARYRQQTNALVAQVPNLQTHFGKNSFDVALNVGLRTNIAKHHGIEVVAKVPFLATNIATLKGSVDIESFEIQNVIKHTWNLNARYTFSF